MKRNFTAIILILTLSLVSTFAQQTYTQFIDAAQFYAAKNISMFRFNLAQNFAIVNRESLNSFYSQFGNNWGNVVMALSICKTSGNSMGKMLSVYNRTKPTDWNKITNKLIRTAPLQDSLNSLLNRQVVSWQLQIK